MRTRKIRLISALLAVAMMFVMVPVGAWAEDASAIGVGPGYDLGVRKGSDNKDYYYNVLDESKNITDTDGSYTSSGQGWEFKFLKNRTCSLTLTSGVFDLSSLGDIGSISNLVIDKNAKLSNCIYTDSSNNIDNYGIISGGTFFLLTPAMTVVRTFKFF